MKLFSLLGLATAGFFISIFGLFRLGWLRHGPAATDFGFLHLDWIFQPTLPYWEAHMFNLLLFFGGLVCMAIGIAALIFLLANGDKPMAK